MLPILACSAHSVVYNELVNTGVMNDGSTLKWWLYWHGGGSLHLVFSTSGPSILSNEWYSIELKHATSSGSYNDGEDELFVNGQLVISVRNISNNDRGSADTLLLGGYHLPQSTMLDVESIIMLP